MSLSRSILLGGLPPVSRTAAAPAAAQPAEAVAPVVAAATPWSAIVSELGIGRADLCAEAPQPGAVSEEDEFGWGAIARELNANPPSRFGSNGLASSPNGGATDWATIIAEAGLAPNANPPTASFGADPTWAMLAAEVAAERPANL